MAVLVTNDFPPQHGGIQRCMSRLAQELTLRGKSISVVAPRIAGSADFDTKQKFNVERYPNANRLVGFAAMVVWLFRARIASRRSYTLASMWFPGGLAACFLPRFLRGRLGVLAHGTEIAPSRGGIRRHVMRFVFAQADDIIANSRFTRELVKKAGVRNSVSVVHLGIDDDPITAAPAATPVILSVGRLVERKGFDKVIAALPAIVARFPSARYEIVGNGPMRAQLQQLAESLGVAHAVRFLGAIDDAEMREAYARAWCFALPVRAIGDDVEGFGLVYLEAALAGLPAVGGQHSGAEDAIAPGETGLLVDGTSTDEVAGALLALLSEPEQSRQMGMRARERALTQFTWAQTAKHVADIMDGASRSR